MCVCTHIHACLHDLGVHFVGDQIDLSQSVVMSWDGEWLNVFISWIFSGSSDRNEWKGTCNLIVGQNNVRLFTALFLPVRIFYNWYFN